MRANIRTYFELARKVSTFDVQTEVVENMKEKQLKGKRKKEKLPEKKDKREHRVTFMLNDKEYNAIERHLRKYKVKNKSMWYRHTILTYIWKAMGEDYPT